MLTELEIVEIRSGTYDGSDMEYSSLKALYNLLHSPGYTLPEFSHSSWLCCRSKYGSKYERKRKREFSPDQRSRRRGEESQPDP